VLDEAAGEALGEVLGEQAGRAQIVSTLATRVNEARLMGSHSVVEAER
jgi:hypothetical protein